MIKSLLEQDAEEQVDRNKLDTAANESGLVTAAVAAPQYVEVNEAEDLLETSELSGASAISEGNAPLDESFRESSIETTNKTEYFIEPPDQQFVATVETTNVEKVDFPEIDSNRPETFANEKAAVNEDFRLPAETESPNFIFPSDNINRTAKTDDATDVIFQKPAETQSFAETARQSGLAYAAAITLFASVVFMLIIGWFADLLFGSSPWGKVVGIIVGSLIGFIQLFRITSQIFNNKD